MTSNMLSNELSPEEEQILEGFADPDEPVNESQFKWDEEFQREILSMLLKDRPMLIQSIGLIQPKYFTNEIHALIAKILFKYFEAYKSMPKKALLTVEFEEAIENKKIEIKQYYRQEFHLVYEYFEASSDSREYILDKITRFAKRMALKEAFGICSKIMMDRPEDDNAWDDIEANLKKALVVNRDSGIGLDYFANIEERYLQMRKKEDDSETFTSAFHCIDKSLSGGGLHRGEIGAWMGLSGAGKSLALVKAAKANLSKGHKVLYVSLELDSLRVAERFDAQLADPTKKNGVEIGNLLEKEEYVIQGLNDYLEDNKDLFGDDKQRLIIKQFAGGSMGVSELRAYMNQLTLYGFRPDLVIVDYVGEMKDYPNMPTWESRQKIVRDLRGLAVEEQVCLLTALQPGKSAKEVIEQGGLIDDANLADAYGQIRPLDAFWSINQTQDESKINVLRGYIAKHRHGKAKIQFFLEIDKETLEIKEISEQEYKRRKHQYEQLKEVSSSDMAEEKLTHQKRVEAAQKRQAEKGLKAIEGKKDPMVDLASEQPMPIESKEVVKVSEKDLDEIIN